MQASVLVLQNQWLDRQFPFVTPNFVYRVPYLDTVIAVISVSLFATVTMGLFELLHCGSVTDVRTSTNGTNITTDFFVLHADPSIVCWEGKHVIMAAVAMSTIIYYVVSTSIMTLYFIELKASSELHQLPAYLFHQRTSKILLPVVSLCFGDYSFGRWVLWMSCASTFTYYLMCVCSLSVAYHSLTAACAMQIHQRRAAVLSRLGVQRVISVPVRPASMVVHHCIP